MKLGKAIWFSAGLLATACMQAPADRDVSNLADASWPDLAQADAAGDFSEQGLADLNASMQGFVDDGQVLGIEWVLVKDGEVAQYGAYGLQDAETSKPVSSDTIYRIYSMSKPITGVALMQLHEKGLFELDDPLSKYIPEFADLKVLAGENEDGTPILEDLERAPTIRDAMTHTAGFAYGLSGSDFSNRQFREKEILRSADLETLIDRVADVPLLFQPGERWSYSVSVDIQGYLVQKLSGMPFGAYLEANVFEPLKMADTGFYASDEDYDRLADLMFFSEKAGRFVPIYSETVQFRQSTIPFESGGGGLVSTLGDYARFCQMLLNEGELGGTRILSEASIELMTTDQLPEGVGIGFDGSRESTDEGEPHKFGLDFGLITDPGAMKSPAGKGTFYWGGAAGTWFWIDPENDLFFIGMIQRFGSEPGVPFDPRGVSVDLVYEALKG